MISLSYEHLFRIPKEHGITPQEIQDTYQKIPSFLQGIHTKNQGFYAQEVLQNETLIKKIEIFGERARKKYTHCILLGIGGSALGPRVFQEIFQKNASLEMRIIDNLDPDFVEDSFANLPLKTTLFLVVTKSGGTTETIAPYFLALEMLKNENLQPKDHIVAITDPHGGFLREEVQKYGLESFPVPENVGGRFSVLTAVGLVPAVLLGINIRELLAGAIKMREQFICEEGKKNLPFQLALIQYLLLKKGKTNHILYAYSQKLVRCTDWVRQLIAESTGKRENIYGDKVYTGITPIPALGVTDHHSQNQLYMEGPFDKAIFFFTLPASSPVRGGLRWGLGGTKGRLPAIHGALSNPQTEYLEGKTIGEIFESEQKACGEALTEEHRPHCTLEFSDLSEKTLGEFFLLFEGATAFLGEFLEINAFDQPGVERTKVLTKEFLAKK